MTTPHPRFLAAALVLVCAAGPVRATAEEPETKAWSFSASAFAYSIPDDRDYVQPTFIARRASLHLEARYNYESPHTASVWIGATLETGEQVTLSVTPMIGGVFGNAKGIAPGYRGSLGWRKLELTSEGEYVFDTADSSRSFFYDWSELTLAPAAGFRFGAAVQRTRAYTSDRDIQRGVVAAISLASVDLSAYVFNPDDPKPLVVVALGVKF